MYKLTALVMVVVHAIEGMVPEVPPKEGFSKMTITKPFAISEISENNSVMSHPLVTALYIWTRDLPDGSPVIVEPGNITSQTDFTPRQTFVIIHGFLGNVSNPWILQIKNKLLTRSLCNVIAVSWYAGYYYASYWDIAARVPHVARVLAQMMNQLITLKGLDASSIHIIGHSLGAHVAGFCAKEISPKVARISGLDPAGPSFRKVGRLHRLDHSDADYVDILHTNGCHSYLVWDCFGIDENIGHSDFWPNGGVYQPSCISSSRAKHTDTRNSSMNFEIGDSCHHDMAYWYFLESIDYNTAGDSRFLARPCGPHNWPLYLTGACPCGYLPQFMGFYADYRSPGIFYLATHSESPYAEYDDGCSVEQQQLKAQIRLHALGSELTFLHICCCTIAVAMLIVFSLTFCIFLIKKNNKKDFEHDCNAFKDMK
ncbi:unnamed protein product, partial [Meganyctiphanes norvegica]